jgi:hypothetical protein
MIGHGAGWRTTWCLLLLCCACSNQPPDWSSLLSSRIRDQYPDTRIHVLSTHTLQATLDARTITVDTDEIALQCNRGPRDCDRAIDQVLLDLRGANPGVDRK